MSQEEPVHVAKVFVFFFFFFCFQVISTALPAKFDCISLAVFAVFRSAVSKSLDSCYVCAESSRFCGPA